MKKTIWKWLAVCFAAICLFCGVACGGTGADESTAIVATVEKEEGFVAITITQMDGEAMLSDVMEQLQAEGKLSFGLDATGMLTQLEGVQNAADWSACWMLYTSDAELANMSYAKEWKGATYGSAVVGVTQLPAAEGFVYLWSYDTF